MVSAPIACVGGAVDALFAEAVELFDCLVMQIQFVERLLVSQLDAKSETS